MPAPPSPAMAARDAVSAVPSDALGQRVGLDAGHGHDAEAGDHGPGAGEAAFPSVIWLNHFAPPF